VDSRCAEIPERPREASAYDPDHETRCFNSQSQKHTWGLLARCKCFVTSM